MAPVKTSKSEVKTDNLKNVSVKKVLIIMEDSTCPRCKTTKFQNPSLKMMVNICGHALCESCVDLLFLKGSGACPDCRIPLRRNNFRVQLFEDAVVEKEVDIRKRVLRDFNKKEEDFNSLKEYNDYLEEVETIIYNLTNDIDVVNTNKRIEQYKKDNRELIQRNKNKLGKDEYELEEILEYEKQQEEQRRAEIRMEEVKSKQKKIRDKEALIDELMFSNVNAKNIVESFANAKEVADKEDDSKPPPPKIGRFLPGTQFGRQSQTTFLPIPTEDGPLYVYKPPTLITNGPTPPSCEEIMSMGYMRNVKAATEQEMAGGFMSHIACMRALQDTLAGLYHVKKTAMV